MIKKDTNSSEGLLKDMELYLEKEKKRFFEGLQSDAEQWKKRFLDDLMLSAEKSRQASKNLLGDVELISEKGKQASKNLLGNAELAVEKSRQASKNLLEDVEKGRQISERSLENLKLGAQSRDKGKQRHNFTVLPETIQWLKGTGNASDAIDSLVEAAKQGGLFSNTIHEWKAKESPVSNDAYEQKIKDLEHNLEEIYLELSKVRSQLQTENALHLDISNLHHDCLSNGFKAAEILKEALTFKPNAGGAIKEKIREALKLIEDI